MEAILKKYNEIFHKHYSNYENLELNRKQKITTANNYANKKGIYIFYENNAPIYVGRTRNLKDRINMHSRISSDFNSASFAFLLAKKEYNQKDLKRKDLKNDDIFGRIFLKQKERISEMEIKFIEIEDDIEQAIFEILLSEKLDTPFNSFKTH